jgi:DNA-binding winged helix-turn-helix (wHTH) protein
MSSRFAFGSYVLDAERGRLTREGEPVTVGARRLALLTALVDARGKAVNKATLMDAAWPGLVLEESNLSVQIAVLRKLLGPAPDGAPWIETIPRTGYRFVGDIAPSEGPSEQAISGNELRASIIVMPFENLTGSADQDYLVDGITDDIIVALAKFRWFRVASRGTSFAQEVSVGTPGPSAKSLAYPFYWKEASDIPRRASG